MSTALALLTGATLLASGLGGSDVAALPDVSAADAAEGSARIAGVIGSIADSGFALDTPSGAITVVTGEDTRFRIPGVDDPGLDDLTIGDHVLAIGRRGEGGLFHAAVVALLRPDVSVPIGGKITELARESLTIRTERSLVTIYVDGETRYRIRGVENATFADLEVGMKVLARAVLRDDGSLLAKTVAAAARPRRIELRGQVTAIDGRTFTLRTGEGRDVEVLTDDETVFRVPGVENPTIADLEVGDLIAGRAVVEEEGVVRATHVVVVPDQLARVSGHVTAIVGRTLVIIKDGVRIDIVTDAETEFRIPGVENPSISDIGVGYQVLAVGTWEDATTFQAVGVGARPPQELPTTIRGRAVQIGDDYLIVATSRGQVRVLVNNDTKHRIPGVRDPGLDDFRLGALVQASGEWTADLALTAHMVAALSPGVENAQGVEAGAGRPNAAKAPLPAR
ncbi:MAG: hypothetical protein E3J64_08120 [Anaerolineales bacterium]|nr:MAG: hypothetical protein E3J64_08120 [Anaerolineales bacterium]